MMKTDQAWQDFLTLSVEARKQVCALITFLKQQHQTADAAPDQKVSNISEEPFIGIWKDRDDMTDSDEWVRGVRAREWREESVTRDDH